MTLDWTPIAAAELRVAYEIDLRAAYEYVAEDNVAAAKALLERIFSAVERLGQYPRMGRGGRVEGTRELVITGTPFVVVYRTGRDRVEVLAVLHAARRWPEEFWPGPAPLHVVCL